MRGDPLGLAALGVQHPRRGEVAPGALGRRELLGDRSADDRMHELERPSRGEDAGADKRVLGGRAVRREPGDRVGVARLGVGPEHGHGARQCRRVGSEPGRAGRATKRITDAPTTGLRASSSPMLVEQRATRNGLPPVASWQASASSSPTSRSDGRDAERRRLTRTLGSARAPRPASGACDSTGGRLAAISSTGSSATRRAR